MDLIKHLPIATWWVLDLFEYMNKIDLVIWNIPLFLLGQSWIISEKRENVKSPNYGLQMLD